MKQKHRPIRLGVIGVRRGMDIASRNPEKTTGLRLVAICDKWESKLKEANKKYKVATYTDFDDFLQHDMDAVILANYFHEHAPFAIKALKAGLHVLSECTACKTPAEGVALIEAVEKYKKVYFLAENYPFFNYNQEMKRIYDKGEIGEIYYGECEYIHPGSHDWVLSICPGFSHWRNHNPATYYCTHSLGPLMLITGRRPVSVNGFVIPYQKNDRTMRIRKNDLASVMMCRLDNNGVIKIAYGGLMGEQNYTRIHCTHGLMENARLGDTKVLRIKKEPWDKKRGEKSEKIYKPGFPFAHKAAGRAGHSGGDFFTLYHFADAIKRRTKPLIDIYMGVTMSMVGIQAWRSALEGGKPKEIPDFRIKAQRNKYRKDNFSPFAEDKKGGKPYSSILGDYRPTKKAKAYAIRYWKKMGYANPK
jgi:predicted dehydrogenase